MDIGWTNDEKYDGQIYYSADPDGLYIGELEGEKMAIVIMAMYGNKEFCHVGYFLVKNEHRGKGYGKKIWDYAWSKIPDSCSITLDALEDMVPKYEISGFKTAWKELSYTCSAEEISSLSLPSSCSELIIKFYGETDFDFLVEYDASVFGFRRESLLKTFLTIPCCKGWVACDQEGKIRGHCNLLKVKGKPTWSVSPLYADDASIAHALLSRAAQFVLKEDRDASLNVIVPDANNEGMKLIKSVHVKFNFEYVRMFARGIPRGIEENVVKVFSVGSIAIG